MSDSKEDENKEKPSEGMVRKTRRVRKKRRTGGSSRDKTDAANLFSKAKELLIGMQDQDEDYGPVGVAEQIRRLKQRKEDELVLDDAWGTKKRSTTWLWIVLVGVIGAVIAVVIGVTLWVNDQPNDIEDPTAITEQFFKIPPDRLGEGPLGWIDENSIEVLDEAIRITHAINEAQEAGQIEKLARDSPFRSLNALNLDDWGSKRLTTSLSGFSWSSSIVYSSEESGSKERGYFRLSGRSESGADYSSYFVRENNRVVLDWDATVGWSEKSVEEMIAQPPRKDTLLRCKVEKKPSYDQEFGAKKYSGFVLSGDELDQYFFAYVDLESDRGKAMERDLRLLLNYGSFVTNEPPLIDQKATLRVKFDSQVGKDGIYEIVEYLNDGWVTP